MANKPDFNLNEPFQINNEELSFVWDFLTQEEQNNYLNQMWRNFAINVNDNIGLSQNNLINKGFLLSPFRLIQL